MNLADEPSRDEFGLLRELGSEAFDVRWPDMDSSWAGAFERILDANAGRFFEIEIPEG